MSEQVIHNQQYVGVYGIVQNGFGEVLLIQKTRGPYIGKLDLPGGKIEHGEEPLKALARELREEVGIFVTDAVLIDNRSVTVLYDKNGEQISFFHLGLVYAVRYDIAKGEKLDIVEQDVGGASWNLVQSLDTEKLSPFAHFAVEYVRSKKELILK